jgi:hypothetical protein
MSHIYLLLFVTMPVAVALYYQHYLELRKMREHRLKLLQDQQKRVQQHERSLFKIRNHLAKAVTELAQVRDKLDQLITSDVWVTADEHAKIHHISEKVEKQYSEWNQQKTKKHQLIDQEAAQAKIHASHIIGIERALVCLEDHMRQQFPDYSKRKTMAMPTVAVEECVYLRRSKSQLSFTSIITADSKNSTSLSGALLKKWLKPRLMQSQLHQMSLVV